jgi:anti-sigma regulatory factor (Ser/Thr protein kinase)
LVADTLAAAHYEGDVDTVLLLVSELCTNAVRHAATAFEVHIDADRGEVTVTVVDHDPAHRPQLRDPGPDALSGRGLFIVERLSKSWGCDRHGTHAKSVWFCCA